jgi:antitoxin MazE
VLLGQTRAREGRFSLLGVNILPMTRTLTVIGDSLGLILDKPLLEQLRIDKDTPLEIQTEGQSLIIRPVRAEDRRSRLRAATEKMMDAHDETLRKLAK